MAVEDMEIPVYLISGFLESGKTTFLDGTIHQNYFRIPETTLLILCEEGEIEYNEKELKRRCRTVTEVIESQEDFTKETLEYLEKKHRPGRVLVEYNPLWSVDQFRAMELPENWVLVQEIVTVDAGTFQIYMNNMKSIFVEMVRNADMVIFNRISEELPLASFRRSVKVVNPACEIIFENKNHDVVDIFEDSLPYDLDADVVEIMEEDYGIWYVDMMDHPEDYEGKTVRFRGKVLKDSGLKDDSFVPGRMAMTCCADDTTFLGYVCKSDMAGELETGDWVEVTAEVRQRFMKVYNGKGPVLYAKEVKPCEELAEEMVYFT